jgi:hypothetical protein
MGKSKLDELLPAMPDAARQKLADSLGSGGNLANGRTGDAVAQAYVYALNNGLRIAAVVAATGAVVAWLLIADRAEAPYEVGAESAAGAPADIKPELVEAT